MDFGLALSRIIHVLGGVIWVGSMFFVSMFLVPSMTEAGPDAGKVMAALNRRKWMIFIPVIAILTMLSGIWLYWHASMGFSPAYMRSGPGRTYGLGGGLAIIGFIIGLAMTRPAMVKVGKLMAEMPNAAPDQRDAIAAEIQRQRAKGAFWSKIIGFFLIGAATLMALGRYV